MNDITDIYSEETRFFTLPSGEKVPVNDDNYIETSIVVDFHEVIDSDFEGFLDLISEMATGTLLLSDSTYQVTGVTPEGSLILTVGGDISMIDGWDADEVEDDNDDS